MGGVELHTSLLVASQKRAKVFPIFLCLHELEGAEENLLGVREFLESVDEGELVLEAVELDDDGVLLNEVALLGVEDEFALLFGEMGGEDDLFLDAAEDLVQIGVLGLGKDSS